MSRSTLHRRTWRSLSERCCQHVVRNLLFIKAMDTERPFTLCTVHRHSNHNWVNLTCLRIVSHYTRHVKYLFAYLLTYLRSLTIWWWASQSMLLKWMRHSSQVNDEQHQTVQRLSQRQPWPDTMHLYVPSIPPTAELWRAKGPYVPIIFFSKLEGGHVPQCPIASDATAFV